MHSGYSPDMHSLPLISALAPAEKPLLDFYGSRLTDEQMYTLATRPWIGIADAYMAAMTAFRDHGLPEDDSDWHICPSEAWVRRQQPSPPTSWPGFYSRPIGSTSRPTTFNVC
jgi:hypothetical protein